LSSEGQGQSGTHGDTDRSLGGENTSDQCEHLAKLIGLKELAEPDLKRVCKEIKVDGVPVTVVELTGRAGLRKIGVRSPTRSARLGPEKGEPEVQRYSGVCRGGRRAASRITVSVAGGSFVKNAIVARLCGPGELSEAELRKQVTTMTVAGMDATYMDFAARMRRAKGPDRGAMLDKVAGARYSSR